MDPTRHNYYKKLMRLYEARQIPSTSLTEVEIAHDDWCGVYSGGYCNCEPDVTIRSGSQASAPKHDSLEEVRPLVEPTGRCPHCGAGEFIVWQKPGDSLCRAISCNDCGAVVSSTHPLDPEDRPMRRP